MPRLIIRCSTSVKTAVPQVSHRGTQVEQADICSTCVPPACQQKTKRWNARNPLPCLKNHGLFHLGHQKNNIPPHLRATAPLRPRVGFSRAGWEPAPPGKSQGDVGARCGNGRTSRPCHSERSEESVLSASSEPRRGQETGSCGTDPSTSLCSAQDDSAERSAQNRSTRCAPLLAEQSVSQCLCNLPFGRRYRTHWTWDAEAG